MMKIAGVCMTGVLATFLMPVATVAAPMPYGAPAASGYMQDGWDVPPAEFDEMTRHGFHDGVEAARLEGLAETGISFRPAGPVKCSLGKH